MYVVVAILGVLTFGLGLYRSWQAGSLEGAVLAARACSACRSAATTSCSRGTWSISKACSSTSMAFTNVIKHARASEIRVTTETRDGFVRVSIIDNGRGFDATTATEGRGLGNQAQRAEAIGGVELLFGADGTAFALLVPIESYGDEEARPWPTERRRKPVPPSMRSGLDRAAIVPEPRRRSSTRCGTRAAHSS